MVDPISAIGVAATSLQFLTFSLDALELCRQIRDDVDGATKANRTLEVVTKQLNSVLGELRAVVGIDNQSGRRINRIALDCIASSDELLTLLREIRGANSSKAPSAAKATLTAIKATRKIEKLKNAMKEKQALLDTALAHDTRNRVNLLSVEQSKAFEALDIRVKSIETQLLEQQVTLTGPVRNVELALDSISAKEDNIRSTLTNGQRAIHKDIERLSRDFENGLGQLSRRDLREELLASLFYPEHELRKEMLKPAWRRTFDWVLNEYRFSDRSHTSSWANFPNWLRTQSGLYWISGKAGSGKSTLVAYILNEPSTIAALQSWASGDDMHIISFFMWRPGSPLQRGMQGLLRSLLFQILDQMPGLATHFSAQVSVSLQRLPTWSENKLRKMLESALQEISVTQRRLCIIIDGLDEFDGDLEDLLSLVLAFQHYKHVKCCVSSRPDAQIERRFSHCARLRLEDLNRQDISRFVHDKLSSCERNPMIELVLAEEITRRAQGVFLWAALTTQSVLRGIAAGDDYDLLRSRLDQTPSDINELFVNMLRDIDEVHKISLAFYLRAKRIFVKFRDWTRLHVVLLAACRTQNDPVNYCRLIDFCERTEKEVVAQSKGFLEAQCHYEYCTQTSDVYTWVVSQSDVSKLGLLSSHTSEDREKVVSSRQRKRFDREAQQLRRYENTSVQWIHRSAYDFLFTGESELASSLLCSITDIEVAYSLAEGIMKLLAVLPTPIDKSLRFPGNFKTRAEYSVNLIARLAPYLGDCVFAYLKEVQNLIGNYKTKEMKQMPAPGLLGVAGAVERTLLAEDEDLDYYDVGALRVRTVLPLEFSRDSLQLAVWGICTRRGFLSYVQTNFEKIRSCVYGPSAVAQLLTYSIGHSPVPWSGKPTFEDRINFVLHGLQIIRTFYIRDFCKISSDHLPELTILPGVPTGPNDHFSWSALEYSDNVFTSWIEGKTVYELVATLFHWIEYCASSAELTNERDSVSVLSLWHMMRSLVSTLSLWNVFVGVRGSIHEQLIEGLTTFADFEIKNVKDDGTGKTKDVLEDQCNQDQDTPFVRDQALRTGSFLRPLLQASVVTFVWYTLKQQPQGSSRTALQDIFGDIIPSFRLVYIIKKTSTLSRFSRFEDEGPLPCLEAVYELEPILSERLFAAAASSIDGIISDLEHRIELDPENPKGLFKVSYRNRRP